MNENERTDYWQACPQIECADARACQGYQGSPWDGGCLVPKSVRLKKPGTDESMPGEGVTPPKVSTRTPT